MRSFIQAKCSVFVLTIIRRVTSHLCTDVLQSFVDLGNISRRQTQGRFGSTYPPSNARKRYRSQLNSANSCIIKGDSALYFDELLSMITSLNETISGRMNSLAEMSNAVCNIVEGNLEAWRKSTAGFEKGFVKGIYYSLGWIIVG